MRARRGPLRPWLSFQVHTACKESLLTRCPLGLCKVSVIPPTALNSIDSDGGCHTHAGLSPFSRFSRCAFPSPTPALAVLVILRCGWEEVRPSRRGERSYVHRWQMVPQWPLDTLSTRGWCLPRRIGAAGCGQNQT